VPCPALAAVLAGGWRRCGLGGIRSFPGRPRHGRQEQYTGQPQPRDGSKAPHASPSARGTEQRTGAIRCARPALPQYPRRSRKESLDLGLIVRALTGCKSEFTWGEEGPSPCPVSGSTLHHPCSSSACCSPPVIRPASST